MSREAGSAPDRPAVPALDAGSPRPAAASCVRWAAFALLRRRTA